MKQNILKKMEQSTTTGNFPRSRKCLENLQNWQFSSEFSQLHDGRHVPEEGTDSQWSRRAFNASSCIGFVLFRLSLRAVIHAPVKQKQRRLGESRILCTLSKYFYVCVLTAFKIKYVKPMERKMGS